MFQLRFSDRRDVVSDVVVKLYVSKLYKYKWSVTLRKLIKLEVQSAGSPKYLPERCHTSVPAVTTNFYRNSVPARKYLPERRSGTTTPLTVIFMKRSKRQAMGQ